MSSSLFKSALAIRMISSLAAGFIRLVGVTSRWEYQGYDKIKELLAQDRNIIFAFWHNRFTVMPLVYIRKIDRKKMSVMVSRSHDGDLLAALIGAFGFYSARGSSSRGGKAALLELTRLLSAGSHVALTPDGPRGPRHQVQDGAVALASLSGAPLVPVSFASTHCKIIMGSWDHMRLPLPLGKIKVVFKPPLMIPGQLDRSAREIWRKKLEENMLEADREAAQILKKGLPD